ncbi:hypothetical protein IKG20_00570 [Candidatus Saccharibacteria bacterium]|nr:hypothetical protein [Candidatus Saccharibacteria bacterium]
MAKFDKAIGKRLKISKAQRMMLLAVAGASLILGVCLVFSVYFLKYIKFNSVVISEKDRAVKEYSKAIKNLGVCKAPSGEIYNSSELKSCDPNTVSLNYLSGTLRHNVIVELAQSKALESVGREDLSRCYDTSTGKKRSFDWMLERYKNATTLKDEEYYLKMISTCSALRVIPDALPSAANPLALGASINKIFTDSKYEPDGITPGSVDESSIPGLSSISVSLRIEASTSTTMDVLRNIEKSIREVNIKSARIETSGDRDILKIEANAEAFYTEPVTLNELIEEVRGDGRIIKNSASLEAGK